MLISEIITEAVFSIDDVVDYIFNKVYKDFFTAVAQYKNGNPPILDRLELPDEIIFTTGDIAQHVNNKKFIQAHELNPLIIKIGLGKNYYQPLRNEMSIGFTPVLYQLIRSAIIQGDTYDQMISAIRPDTLQKNADSEFTGVKVKGSIAHEISHWIDDTLHARHINTMLKKSEKTLDISKANAYMYRGEVDIYLTDYEINAIIHDIVQIKRDVGQKKWDLMSFEDLLGKAVAINATYKRIKATHTKADVSRFIKLLVSRMHREHLIGKNMKV